MTQTWDIRSLGPGLALERFGGKAARLGEALGIGLPVPAGVALDIGAHAAFRQHGAVPDALREAVTAHLDALGPGPWAVRTSALDEDGEHGSAAGLYHTELHVGDPGELCEAMARCYAATQGEALAAYRRARGAPPAGGDVALLIQHQVKARWAGVLFTRDPRAHGPAVTWVTELVERSTTLVTAGLSEPRRLSWDPATPPSGIPLPHGESLPVAPLSALGGQAEALLGGPADVEWAWLGGDAVALLQLRPITAAPASARPLATTAPEEQRYADGVHWTWDREHNPDPLSPLHASLVAHLDQRLDLPFRMAVLDGYLYTAPAAASPDGAPDETPDEAAHWWRDQGAPSLRDHLAELESRVDAHAPWDDILATFDRFYLDYAGSAGPRLAAAHARHRSTLGEALSRGELGDAELKAQLSGVATPLVRAVQDLAGRVNVEGDLRPWLERGELPPDHSPGGADYRAAFQEHLARLGGLSAAWDVASPTLDERPEILHRAAARLAGAQSPPPAPRTSSALHATLAAEEEDDLHFARALAALRRALLRAGAQLQSRGRLHRTQQVFDVTLELLGETLRNPETSGPPLSSAAGRAGSAVPSPTAPAGPVVLRGVGTGGGPVEGIVHRVAHLGEAFGVDELPESAVVVCAALLPSAVPLLVGARAVVTDHGGLLSHGAILARELGIPAVLGTRWATGLLRSGDRIWLDADLGLVVTREEA